MICCPRNFMDWYLLAIENWLNKFYLQLWTTKHDNFDILWSGAFWANLSSDLSSARRIRSENAPPKFFPRLFRVAKISGQFCDEIMAVIVTIDIGCHQLSVISTPTHHHFDLPMPLLILFNQMVLSLAQDGNQMWHEILIWGYLSHQVTCDMFWTCVGSAFFVKSVTSCQWIIHGKMVWVCKSQDFLFWVYLFDLLWKSGWVNCLETYMIRFGSSKGVDSAIFHYFRVFSTGVAKFSGVSNSKTLN